MPSPSRLSAALLSILLAGVAFLGHDQPAAAQQGQQESAAHDGTDKQGPSAQKLLEEAGDITDQVAKIRGLPPTNPIEKGVKTRKELRAILIEKLAEEQSKKDIEHEADVFRKLGLIAPDLDYREMILDVLTEQIAGFYDQKANELNIMVGIPLSFQRPAMAHEIFHAIQDQHFDLDRMLEPFSAKENGDFSLARSALVEGDATILMIDYSLYEEGTLPQKGVTSIVDIPPMASMLQQLEFGKLGALEKLGGQVAGTDAPAPGQLADSALSKAPSIIQRVLVFPYLAGLRFVIAMRTGRSWKEFNAVYDNAPVSTEQILHPERYARQDEPVSLSYDTSPVLEGRTTIYDTVFGEYQMRLFLEKHLKNGAQSVGVEESGPTIDITEATTGWDGDRLRAFKNEEGEVLITHQSVWDTDRDAIEYYNALVEATKRRFPDARTHTARGKHGSSLCFYVAGNDHAAQRIYVERWGDAVLHIEGAPTALNDDGEETNSTTYRLRDAIWKSTDRTPFREVLQERQREMKIKKENEEKAATEK